MPEQWQSNRIQSASADQLVQGSRSCATILSPCKGSLDESLVKRYLSLAGMGTNVAGSWQKAVKLLQECSSKQSDSAEADAAECRVHDLIDKLMELPTPPKAVWKKMVQQLQVCSTQDAPTCCSPVTDSSAAVLTAPGW